MSTSTNLPSEPAPVAAPRNASMNSQEQALRGAATGAGSLGRLVLVLITVFSGCGVVGCCCGFGLGFGELAGFHIFRTSFLILIDCSTQPALRRLLIREKNFWENHLGQWHVSNQTSTRSTYHRIAKLALLSAIPRAGLTPGTAFRGCNYSHYLGTSYIGQRT